MTGLQAAWEAVERDGWEVVWLGRRLGRPHPRRWLAQAIRYRPSDRRAMAWGETAVDALVKLADEIATLATLDSRKPVVVDERHDWRNPPASLPSLAPRPVEATTTAGRREVRQDRRLTLEGDILGVVSSYGGEVIVANPRMEQLVRDLADLVEDRPELASDRAWESVTSQSRVQTSDLQGTPTEGSDGPRS